MKFSERQGLVSVRSALQVDSMDQALRNGLWNTVHVQLFSYEPGWRRTEESQQLPIFRRMWHEYFKEPRDTLPLKLADVCEFVRRHFFKCKWNEVYDYIEFLFAALGSERAISFAIFVNKVLEREMAGFRLVGGEVSPISSEEEVSSLEAALKNTGRLVGPNTHLRSALGHLSDRTNPDYRNSVKESISAVESICKLIVGQPKATLGEALQKLEKDGAIHPALKRSLGSLYGYTSDASGIRHAMLEEASIGLIDAKFMLVSCAGFINYLVGKAAELGIKMGSEAG